MPAVLCKFRSPASHNTAANPGCLHFALNTAAIHHFIPLVIIIIINIALIFQPQILQHVSGCGDIGHCKQMDLSLLFQHHTFNVVTVYIPRLSLSKTSIVIGWFLVTCPWSNSNVFQPGYNCIAVAHMLNTTACDQCMTKLKMVWSSAHAHVS